MTETPKFDPAGKKTGLAHVLAATGYSLSGLRFLSGEAAFRHELLAAVILLAAYLALGVAAEIIVLAICLMLITFAAEAINTAIELIIDHTSPEISSYAKNAKDLGSLAVMCLLLANGVVAVYALTTLLA